MINTVIFCCLSFIMTCIGFWIFIKCFPVRRWESKGSTILFWGIFLCLAILQAWDAHHAFISYLQIFFYGFENAFILKIFYICDMRAAILWELFYNINLGILKIPMLTIKGMISKENLLFVNVMAGRDLAENILCAAIIILTIIGILKWKEEIFLIIQKILFRQKLISFLFLLIEGLLLFIMMKTGGQAFKPADAVLNSYLILSIMLMSFSIAVYFMYKGSKAGQENLAKQQSILLEEQKVIKECYEQDTKRLHDVKRVLLYLQNCIDMKELEKADKSLKQYLGEMKKSHRRIWTGLPDVDFIVNYEYQKMVRRGIKFTLNADLFDIPVPEMEFTILLGNLLDNAIEAAEKCPDENRWVFLKLRSVNNMFMLQVENTMKDKPKENKGRFICGWVFSN